MATRSQFDRIPTECVPRRAPVRIIVTPGPRANARSRDASLAGLAITAQLHAAVLVAMYLWTFAPEVARPVRELVVAATPGPTDRPLVPLRAARAAPPRETSGRWQPPQPPDLLRSDEFSDAESHLFELFTEDVVKSAFHRAPNPAPSDAFRLPATRLLQSGREQPAAVAGRANDPTAEFPTTSAVGVDVGPSVAPTVEYFGVRATAYRIIYVVDASQSMLGDPFERARKELTDSIGRLDATQRFGVVFFAQSEAQAFPVDADLVPATKRNAQEAARWIGRQRPRGGTQADAALTKAYEFRPDVIFFLSDGSLPQRMIDGTRTSPAPGTIIHTIGFMSRGGEHTLRRLAEAHHGLYHFVPK